MDQNIFLTMLRQNGVEVPSGTRLGDRLDRLRKFIELGAPEVVVINECALVVAAAAKEGRPELRKTLDEAMADLGARDGGPRAPEAAARPAAGRNDPCPCGSGKKYKKCCL